MPELRRLALKIREDGLTGLPTAAARSARFRLQRLTSEFYREHLYTNSFLARLFPFKRPPILLLSYPRSGSSWIGKVLSFSPDVAYLREPVHQTFQKRFQVPALLEPDSDRQTLCCHRRFDAAMLDFYLKCADLAFRGIVPSQAEDILDDGDAFRFLGRCRRSLLIKEINPLMTEYFVRLYGPKVVTIVRHPAAIADSFIRLNWLDGNLEDFGFLYGIHLKESINATQRGWSKLVAYEDFAKAPLENFSSLFTALNLREPSNLEAILAAYCKSHTDSNLPYDIRRSSVHEAEKWRQNLRPTQIDEVMRGYYRSGLGSYLKCEYTA